MAFTDQERVEIGGRLSQVRKGLGLTQQELADKLEIDRSYYAGIERGHASVSTGKIGRMAVALGVDRDWLLYGDETPASTEVQLERMARQASDLEAQFSEQAPLLAEQAKLAEKIKTIEKEHKEQIQTLIALSRQQLEVALESVWRKAQDDKFRTSAEAAADALNEPLGKVLARLLDLYLDLQAIRRS